MKTANYLMIVLAAAFCFGAVAHGGSADKAGYMGIRMDPRPLPDLLVKHLRLKDRQGVRIQNVGIGLPAEKAGLERDDIVIGLNGKDVLDSKSFADAVQQAGPGAEITLDIIHLGKRKTVKLKLASFDEDSQFKPKFPPEPEAVQSWQPGRMFHLQPDAQSWVQVGPGASMFGGAGGAGGFGGAGGGFGFGGQSGVDSQMNTFFNEIYTFAYSTNGDAYNITIEGNPSDKDTKVVVKASGKEYTATVGNLTDLPAKYRESAEEALKNARRNSRTRRNRRGMNSMKLPKMPDWPFDPLYQRKDMRRYQPPEAEHKVLPPKLEPRDRIYEKIEEELRQMQQRIEQLENQRGKTQKSDETKSAEDPTHRHEHDNAHEHSTADAHSHEGQAI